MEPNSLSTTMRASLMIKTRRRRSRVVRALIVLALVACVTLVAAPGVGYARPEPPNEINSPAHVEDDGGIAEMGVEWITDWPGTDADRANWYYSANYLYNELLNRGWIGRFNWGNTNAWERDFKRAASGGNGLVDSVDLAMIGTHGTSAYDSYWGKNLSAVYFSSNNDDWFLSPGEAYHYYGTNDLEWLIFDSCSVLRDDSMAYWHATFNGLHQMLGFANTMYVVYPGDGGVFADRARYKGWWHPAKTVTQAWFSAVSNQQPSGVKARVLAEELNNYNDYLWGEGYVSPDYSNNGGYWYWDHWSGTPAPLQLSAPAPTALPVYTLLTRTVDMTYTAQIGQAFDLTDTSKIHQDGSTFYMVDAEAPQPPFPPPTLRPSAVVTPTKLLQVDVASGGFFFQKLDELWTNPEMPRALPPSGARAEGAADSFLLQNGKSLPGYIGRHLIVTPTVELEGPANGPPTSTVAIAASTPTSPTNYAIDYARTVDIGGGQQVSVVGPGSRLNVYIGDNNLVAGLQGGWRDVMPAQVNVGVQSTAAVTVPIKTSDKAWADFIADPHIALAQPPAFISYTQKLTPTLAYYEQASVISQTELIPVWVFVADLYTGTVPGQMQVQSTQAITLVLVAGDVNLYVPAEASSTALPQASIISPTAGTIIVPGQSLVLNGAVTGGTAPYTFQWTSSEDGLLGTSATLTSPGLHASLHDGSLTPNVITLSVTDANGLQSTATVNVTVLGWQLYLPITLKQ